MRLPQPGHFTLHLETTTSIFTHIHDFSIKNSANAMQQLHAAMKNGRHPFFVSRISEGCPPLRVKRSNKIAQKKKQCAGQMNKPLSNFLSIAIIHVSEKGELILSRAFKRPASRSVLRIGQENPHSVRRIYLEGDPCSMLEAGNSFGNTPPKHKNTFLKFGRNLSFISSES